MEGILCEGLVSANGPRREDQDIEARCEDVGDEWRVDRGSAGGAWRTRASRYRLRAMNV